MNRRASLILATLVSACAAAPRVRPTAAAYTPPPRPTVAECEHQLPRAVGGFEIWDARTHERETVAATALRCIREGYVWTEMDDGGTCSETPLRVLYAASARFLACDDGTVCAVQLRYSFGGDTALRDGTGRLWETLTERYGEGTEIVDEATPCPRVEGDRFACVLDGVGIAQYEWRLADPSARDACDAPTAIVALRAEGDRGTHDARVTVTYVTADAIDAFARIAL